MNETGKLDEIRKQVVKVGSLAKASVHTSMEALRTRDSGLCDEVMEIERETDFLNLAIEDACLGVLSRQRLNDKSFRFVAASMNISSRFERIADLMVEVSHCTRRGLPKSLPESSGNIPKMGQIVQEMIAIDLDAFSKDAVASIEGLKHKEREMQHLYEGVYGNLVSHIHHHPESFNDSLLLLTIASAVERAAELTCKIGARIVYIKDGERVWIK